MLTHVIDSAGLMLYRNGFRLKNMLNSLVRPVGRPDTIRLEYSYYLHEASRLGVQAGILGNNVLQLRKNGRVQNIYHAFTDLDGEASLMMAGDKIFCSSLLRRHGIPVPDHAVLRSGDYRGAEAFRQQCGAPVVIKPAKNTGDGRGVSIGPATPFSLWCAVNRAGMFGREIMAEKFCEGTNYRLLFCRGMFLAASSRDPARVTGDGVRTVRALIDLANAGRMDNGRLVEYDPRTRPILYKIPVTGSLAALLKRQGLALDSVPLKGEEVRVQDICHWLRGGAYHDVTDEVSPDFIALGKKAVDLLGIKLAGVDLIARDVRAAQPGTYVINEVNTSPGILVHYEVQNRHKLRPVAREIIRSMFP